MASENNLNKKKQIVNEIIDNIKNSESVILFQYQGLTVSEMSELRNKLNEVESSVKIYKNTLLKRALDELKINMDDYMEGPNALLIGKTLLEPIKIVSEYAKDHEKLNIRVGIISGDVADLDKIKEYATIPSREGLLTMLAGGMIQYLRDLSIGLNLYAEGKEGDTPSKEETPKVTEEVTEEPKEEVAEEAQETKTEEEKETTEEKTTEEVTENA